ncbi:hypothetical protein [Facklamia miroungae]|uniref:Uncharacterized protein n=1 Tax=Facklamia miroungae TaxID=120956 RepID=A0A1G7UCT3_9LACT|nr:hypothetical protein [Facklamia miroungae]NKZ30053.1 hypothetical protein [Facklamia miroungae]SDG45101.1 hypothetical protein SAMN05421791_10941 [Facklamia miroungae]
MYDQSDRNFHCDHCHKIIETGEMCWTKWAFPPSHLKAQVKPRKEFEWKNAPILCSQCSDKELDLSKF